jgi:hypothetical protein
MIAWNPFAAVSERKGRAGVQVPWASSTFSASQSMWAN